MAFQKPKKQPQFADLKGILAQSKTKLDSATYQTIETLIDRLGQFQSIVVAQIEDIIKSVDDGRGLQGPPGPIGPPGIIAPHAGTHIPGGTDQIPNVAWTNQSNTFTESQIINGTITIGGDTHTGRNYLHRDGSLAMTLASTISMFSDQYDFINKANNDYLMQLSSPGNLFVTGSITEYGRILPLGHWVSYTPTYRAADPSQPNLGNGNLSGTYTIIGKTVHFTIYFSIGNTSSTSLSMMAFGLPIPNVSQLSGSLWIYNGATGQSFTGSAAPGSFFDPNVANCVVPIINVGSSQPFAPFMNANTPFNWTNPANMPSYLIISGTYQIA